MRVMRQSIAVLALTLLLGGCMSEGENSANAPLPRMGKKKAEEWARHWTESMARTAKAEIEPGTDPEVPAANFTNCTGKNGESADDGRFTLRYSVRARLPQSQHAEAVRTIRDTLKEQGLEIQDFRSDPTASPPNLLYARHPANHQFISVRDSDEERLVLIVSTPCLLPPGAEQQQF
ncbi:hypothetical protein ACFXKG_00110 [Streptomyces sp. NPDC059255]|uniref:hypothetical protein n=1 Tax=Streptomyces sp. NPDC059255 TaxID=3346793 RepID=UPI0036D011BC